jgi:uroporphyrinogen III methyltransferase/synthase
VTKTAATSARTSGSGAPRKAAKPLGWVSFVGSGPGDPDLLTVRAVDLIRAADVVVTEVPGHADLVRALVGDAPCPELVDGGFGDDGTPLTNAARAKMVVSPAKAGRRVVRLVSGDPFVHGSGPEEAQAVVKAGVGFEVVPGVSAATAVPAYAGIPVTSKDHREFAVVAASAPKVDWASYADHDTLVLLSALPHIAEIAEALVAAGRSAETPVAMTHAGTTTTQETIVSTLADIAADAKAARLAQPVVTVVGAVVGLREKLSWFETKPLFGWRALVPRTKEQAGTLSARLRGFGAVPEEVPTISVEPPRNPQQMDKAVRGLVEGRYEWIAFTSVNAVKAVREKFEEYGLDARAFSGLKIAAVGDKTAEAIAAWGLRADLVPSGEQSARGLLEDWPPYDDVLDPDQPGLPPPCRHRHREPRRRPGRPGLGVRRRDRVPDGARSPAAGPGARGDQVRQVRRGRVHLVLDGAQPGRHRRQAAHVDGDRRDRSRHGQDRRGARPPGRRDRTEPVRGVPRRRARRLRGGSPSGDARVRPAGHPPVRAAAGHAAQGEQLT